MMIINSGIYKATNWDRYYEIMKQISSHFYLAGPKLREAYLLYGEAQKNMIYKDGQFTEVPRDAKLAKERADIMLQANREEMEELRLELIRLTNPATVKADPIRQ
jgi:hypothetical protein